MRLPIRLLLLPATVAFFALARPAPAAAPPPPPAGAAPPPAGVEAPLAELWMTGEKALSEGRLDDAQRAFQEALTLDPGSGRTWNYLGSVCFAQNDLHKALIRFKRAAELSPRDARIVNNLATVYDRLGQYANAIEHYLAAITLDRTYPVPYRNLGAVYAYRFKDLEMAENYWKTYIMLDVGEDERRLIEDELDRLKGRP